MQRVRQRLTTAVQEIRRKFLRIRQWKDSEKNLNLEILQIEKASEEDCNLERGSLEKKDR